MKVSDVRPLNKVNEEVISIVDRYLDKYIGQGRVNDEGLRAILSTSIECTIDTIPELKDWRVVCDETNNTYYIIDIGEIVIHVFYRHVFQYMEDNDYNIIYRKIKL